MVPTVNAEDRDWRFMGIQSKNRKEWVLTNVAGMFNGITSVALYDTLGPDATRFILNQTELTSISCSIDCVPKLIDMKIQDNQSGDSKTHRLVNIVSFEDELTDEMKQKAQEAGINLYSMEEVMYKGREAIKAGRQASQPAQPDDTYMFSYTSGTTGDPKGVKLTHKMVISCGAAVQVRLGLHETPLSHKDTYVSYLPAAHSFEQAVSSITFIYGMRMGFFAGNVLKLTEDMQVLKPTLFPSVPRLYNRIYGKIQDKLKEATGVKAWLVNKAVAAKMYYHKNG